MTVDSKLLKRSGSPRSNFLSRKTKADAPSIAPDAAADKAPAAQASLIGAAWRGGVDAVIDAGALMMESLQAFGDDPERLDAFITALVNVRLLTPKEAKLRLVSPKLVKLRTIGEHAKLLRRQEIAHFLGPSYSTLYQLIILYRALPENEVEQRVKRLVGLLESCPGEITREFLSDETDRLKQRRKADKAKVVAGGQTAAEAAAGETLRDLAETTQQVDLVLLTPGERDLKLLGDNYADDDTLKRCLPLFEVLQHSDNVAALVVARICDLSVIVDRLLPLCGFGYLSHVLLVRRPTSPDITDAEIIITVERGDMHLTPSLDGRWLDEAGTVDPLAIAARLYPDAAHKVHVFAPARTEGWTCLVGNDSWVEEPSVR